ncbi:MAG: glycoside hydrolase family 31 protein [Planctomycetes bacterium]|nr:glycoside hydrolase family 31 protein [Planctomycetota bacterium]
MASPTTTPPAPARTSLPRLDAGGIQRLEWFRAGLATPGATARLARTLLEDRRRSAPGTFLQREPALTSEPLPEGKLTVEAEWDGSCQRALVRLGEAAHLYGGGSAGGALERTGASLRLWARAGSESESEAPHVHPIAIALRVDGSALAAFADSARDGLLRFGDAEFELTLEGEPFDLWLVEGPDVRALASALRELLGACALPPAWALGPHSLVSDAASASAVLEYARELRARHLHCSVLLLDEASLDRGRPFTWSRSGFQDPARTLSELRELGFRALAPLEPALPVGKHYPAYKSGLDGEHFVLDGKGHALRARGAHGPSSFPDFSQASARGWWTTAVAEHARSGFEGCWSDANLPDLPHVPGGTLPAEALHRGEGGGSHGRFHNSTARQWAEATRVGLAKAHPTQRPYVLSRGGDLGSARSCASAVVAQRASWEELRRQLARVLSLQISGTPTVGIEVGARHGTPSPELLARWHELAALLPFSRSARGALFGHGQEADRAIKTALERTRRFLPTFLSLMIEAHRTGLPIVRPLFFADPTDRSLREIDDQFLLGDDVLVAPVLAPTATQRTVVLPASPSGGWFLFDGGRELLSEGRYTVEAPLGRTPIFVRAGRILVTSPAKPPSAAQRIEEPELHVYFDPRQRAQGLIREDDGPSSADGVSTTELSARVARGRVVIDAFANGVEVVDRGWHVHAHGLAPVKS